MKRGKRNITFYRIVALVLVVVMLPFSDFSKAFAGGQSMAAGLNNQQTTVSTNDAGGETKNSAEDQGEETTEGTSDAGGQEETEKSIGEETESAEDTEETAKKAFGNETETLDAAGADAESANSWERITQEEAKKLQQADASQYEDMSIEEAYVLTEDLEVGNLYITGESLDLNGHSLVVYGEFVQTAGEVILNGGKLVVGKDYRIQTREENPEWTKLQNGDSNDADTEVEQYIYSESAGKLTMTNSNDYLVVCGSFVTDSTVSHEESLTAGTMEVMGDFVQLCTKSDLNFVATKEHQMIFSAAEGQTISMNSTGVDKSRFANMELGIESDKIDTVESTTNDTANETIEGTTGETTGADETEENMPRIILSGNPYVSGEILDRQSHMLDGKISVGSTTNFVDGYFGGGVCILQEFEVPQNETITILGDVDLSKTCSIYGILNVGGNVNNTAAGFNMEGGRLCIGKNLTVKSEKTTAPAWGVKMSHEDDYVLVKGDVYYESGYDQELSNGTLEIKQNAIIKSGFHAKGSHKTLFSGEKKQTIAITNGMYFHILELNNSSEEGVYSEAILPKSQLIRNNSKLSYGSLEGSCGYTLEQDEVIEGDFVLIDDTLDLNGHSLRIKGNLIQVSGSILVNGGLLTIEGDYKQQSELGCDGYLEMTQEKDYVLVNGNMYIETTADTTGKLTNGVLEIKGNFIQKKTAGLNNFKASDDHTLLLSGEEIQTLSMEYTTGDKSQIKNLEVKNVKGIQVENSPYITGIITTAGYPVTGEISIGSTTAFTGGTFIGDVRILQEYAINRDLEIQGNLVISNQVFISKSLNVTGDVVVKPGTYNSGIIMESGSFHVGKNLTIDKKNGYSYGIQMLHENDTVVVDGDFVYCPFYESELSAGTLELKGNVEIGSCFHAKGTHKTILSGDSKQIIIMAEGMYFNILELQNYSEEGVYSEKALSKSQLIRNGCNISYGTIEGSYGETLQEDKIVEGDYILLDDTLDLNGYTLTVKGDFIQSAGEVYVNGGTLIVEGDYRQQSREISEESMEAVYGVSNGLLHMDKEEDSVKVMGSMFVQTTADTTGKLTAGVLEVQGDFVQKNTTITTNFCPSGSHILLLTGTDGQTIDIEKSSTTSAHIANLEIRNSTSEGITFTNSPYIAGNIKTSRGQKINGNINVGTNSVFADGYYAGSICTVENITINAEESLEIEGDMDITFPVSIYGELTVNGNMKVNPSYYRGGIIMEEGSLTVEKNLTVNEINAYAYGIKMLHDEDFILVGGDFVYKPGCEWNLTAGTLELKGDVNIQSSFHAAGTHRTILSGEGKQTITMAEGLYFNILELQNHSEEGVYSDTPLQHAQIIRNGCKLTYGNMEGSFGYTLEQDETIDGDFVLLDDTLDLNGYTLTIKGNLIQVGGEVYINGGKLIVEGDYRQQSQTTADGEETSYGVSRGLLRMDNSQDYVQIKGSVYIQTSATTTDKLTEGVLEVQRDFVQKKTTSTTDFNPSGNHTLLLSGDEGQTVNFEYSGIGSNHIENLIVQNNSEEGITFESIPYVAGQIQTSKGQAINGIINIGSTTSFANGYYAGSVCVKQQITVAAEETLEIEGDIQINYPVTVCGSLRVNGNMEVNPQRYWGGIIMEEGSLVVGKNLSVGNLSQSIYGIQMTHDKDSVVVGGDFLYQPVYEWKLSAGTLELKGNVDIKSSFHATGTHRTILSGDSKQTVTMAEGMYFNILELQNKSGEGVYSDTALQKAQLIRNGCKLTYGDMEGNYGYALEQDEVIEEDFVLIDDTLDLNGHTLTIKGDLIQPGGEVYINGGTLIIEGDYRQQSPQTGEDDEVSYGVSCGLLHMDNEKDSVQIKGSMYIQTNADTTGKLTEGTLELHGDFIQKQTTCATNYNPSGNHTLLLAGDKSQKVNMEYTSIDKTHIANLEIQNNSEEGITFETIPYVTGCVKTTKGQQINGTIYMTSGTTFVDGYYAGDISNAQNVTIAADETLVIEGNLNVLYTISVYGTLTVNGNIEIDPVAYQGGFAMEGGTVNVRKSLNVKCSNVTGYKAVYGISMTHEEDYILVEGDFVYNPGYEWKFSAGTLELKKDVTIQNNFHATGTHKTILSGESKQTVTMADGMYFNILELRNYSDEGVYSATALQKAQLIRNGCKLTYGDMEGIYGFTLQEDYIAEGDLVLIEDVLDLNGHTLTVRGNLIQAGGEILLNGGKLIVEGDYRQQARKTKNGNYVYEAGSGYLTMNNENDQVEITGSFIMQTTAGTEGHYTNGVLTIGGNLQQIGSKGLVAGADHTLCFNGDSTQKIIQETSSVIGNLNVENTSKMGVVLGSDMTILGRITDTEGKMSGSGSMIISSISQLADGNCGGNITLTGESTLESDTAIEGTLTVNGSLKLGTQELHANACVVNGALYVENGTMLLTSYLNVLSYGRFIMTGESGYAYVNGDVTFATIYSHKGLLTQGTLEVKGDFTQKSAANFVATDNHTTVLSKKTTTSGSTKVQTISFSHPGTARFHRLVLKKNLTTGYIFNAVPENIADEVVYEVTDENPPAAVGQVTVGNVTTTAITICYEAAIDDTGVTGYEIYRNGRKTAVTASLSYTDTSLTPGTTYTYTVYAFDADKNLSAASEAVEVTTLADEQAPSKVSGLAVTSSTGSSVTLSWKPASDNVKTTGYTLYRDGELVADNITTTTYKDTGLKKNKLYIYTITASDASGNVSEISEEVHGAVTLPKITYVSPDDYATIGGTQVAMNVRFSSAGNSTGNQVVMEYFDEEKDTWNLITPTPLGQRTYDSSQYYVSYTWDISGFEEDQEMDVRITLTDEDGNSEEKLVTYSLDRTAPKPPKNLEIQESNGTLTLTWDRSVSADLAGTIIRRQAEDGSFEIIKDITDTNVTWYTDTQVETGVSYTYTLQCYDGFGQRGTLSEAVTGVPSKDEEAPVIKDMLPASKTVADTVTIEVKANDNRSVNTISLYGKYLEEEEWNLITEKEAENNNMTHTLNLADYKEGSYQIKALAADQTGNVCENPCIRTYVIDHTGIAKIQLKDSTIGSTSAQITWEDVTEEDFGWFRVEKLENETFVTVEDVKDKLGYTFTGLQPDTTYTIRVTGYDVLGNSGEASEEFTFTTTADTSEPEIVAIFPVSSSYSTSIPLQMKVKDNDQVYRGVISYSVDGENYETIADLYAQAGQKEYTFQYDWDLSALAEGEVSVKFETYDMAGNHNLLTEENTDVINTYTIDKTAPGIIKNMNAEGNDGYAKLTWDLPEEDDIKGYRIYRALEENGIFTVINTLSTTMDYTDSTVKEGENYLYKVSAVDIAGNEGACSKESAATIKKDETAPVVTGIAPATGSVLGADAALKVIATDNRNLASITMEYREKDSDDIWHTIETEDMSGRLAYDKMSWNGRGLSENSIYEVRANAVDANGNVSEDVTAEYTFDLTAPEKPDVKAESDSFAINLSYTQNTEEDFEKYSIYRKAYGEKDFVCIQTLETGEYKDTQVETNQIYYYKVRAYDTRGNYSESDIVNSYASDIDTIAPVASLPENVVTINGIETQFDATASTDNVRIVKYLWDMGDGTTKTGSKVRHTYEEPGNYTVTLTVRDGAGLENSTTCTVIVKNKDDNGICHLTVLDENQVGVSHAYVYVKTGDEENLKLRTDSNGKVTICTKAGMYPCSAFAEGYEPKESSILVSNQEEVQESITLHKGEVVTGKMEVRRMEIDEMVEAGVDFSNPDNYNTYTFSVELKFRQDGLPIAFEGRCVNDGTGDEKVIGIWSHDEPLGDYHPNPGKTIGIMTFPLTEKEEKVFIEDTYPVFVYMTTTQSVSWLKEMYNVELDVFNNGNFSFPIENASATLNLPEGISLAQLKSGQELVQHMKTIEGGGTGSASWVIKGDAPGEYEIDASFHGTLSPFDAPVDARFQTTHTFEVEGGKGIHIIVKPEMARYVGNKYYIQYEILNESSRTFYNLSTTIGSYENSTKGEEVIVKDWQTNKVVKVKGSGGRAYQIADTNKCKVLPITYGGDTIEIGVFEPGDRIYGTYVATDLIHGDSYEEYCRLADVFVDSLKGENLGVEVTVSPIQSHLYKYILYVNCVPIPGNYEYYGDPIDTTTGAFMQTIDGLNMAEDSTIPFSINYNSLAADTKGEAGYGTSHDYEQWVEYNGATITYHSSPYAYCTFYNEVAMKNTTYGRVVNNTVVLDSTKEYSGNYYSGTTEMSEYTMVRNEDKTITLTSPTGEVLYFDTKGKLTRIQKTEHKIWDLTREEGKLTVTDRSSGNSVQICYNDKGFIYSVTDYYGRVETLEYDSDGNLIKVTNPAGNTSEFGYDDRHHLTTAINENGIQYVENSYDDNGRVVKQWQPESGTNTTLTYKEKENGETEIVVKDHRGGKQRIVTNQYGQRVSKEDQNGNTSTYVYDSYGNLLTEKGEEGSGSMYRYDDNGNMIQFIDFMGNITHMTYDSAGNLTNIEGAGGDNISYQHDKYHNITSSTDYKGMVTKYEYNESDQLVKETIEGLGSRDYTYKDGRLVSYTDLNGNETQVSYDDYGNISSTKDALGQETTYEYDILGRRTKVVQPSGLITSYTYDKCGNVLTETVTDGRKNDSGLTTVYTYDLMGRMVCMEDALGRITTYTYDGDGNLLKVSYSDGTTEEYRYDSVGNQIRYKDATGIVTTYEYDGSNRLVSETTNGSTTTYEYYGNGKIRKETYPDGQTMEYLYDSNWNVIQTTKNETYSSGYKTDLAGNVSEIKDPLGNKKNYEFDKYGRTISETDYNGNKTTYEYDANGNCVKTTNALGLVTTMEYDELNRMISVTAHTKEKGDIFVSYTYNADGQTTSVTDEEGNTYYMSYDTFGNATTVTDCRGMVVTSNNYDAYNRLSETYDAEGGKITYAYDQAGRLKFMAEAVGAGSSSNTTYGVTDTATPASQGSTLSQQAVTWYGYENGRLTSVTDPETGVSSYTYDASGNISEVKDPMGNVTKYAYDSMNRVKTVTNALNTAISYTYNAEGLLEEETNGRGQKRSYTYDALGRITKVKDEAGTIRYTYDANGNVLTVKDEQGTIIRTYDELNRVKTYTDYNGNTVTYGYDEMGNRISLTYPGGEIVRYTYDKCGNLETVTDSKGRVTTYEYDENGKVTSITRPDGSCETYTYDRAGRVIEASDVKGGEIIHRYQYTYDLQGNITNIEKSGTEEGKGDLSEITDTTMEYTADNRLASYNGQEVKYDADGNMTYGPLNSVMTEFTYDCRNRLIQAGDTTYEYDAENTRIAVQTKEKRDEYVVDKNTTYSQVLSITTYEKNLLGQFTKESDYTIYTYGIGLISQESGIKGEEETQENSSDGTTSQTEITSNTEYYLYHYNQIGSTTQITDETGKVIYTYTYSAYGERAGTYDSNGNIIDNNSTPIHFLYNGQAGVETDENGLYYMRARYYNTDIKRFINRDIIDGTIQNSQSLNKYSYVQGNPVSLTDPFGLCPDFSGIMEYLKMVGHTLLDIAGFIPVVGFVADLANAYWYRCEGNPEMAMACAISAIPGAGDFIGAGLKGIGWAAKCQKLVKAADVVIDTSRFVGAVAQTELNVENFKLACASVAEEYKTTGKVSFWNGANLALSVVGVGVGAASIAGSASKLTSLDSVNAKSADNYTSFRELMTPEEATRYDAYWSQGAGSYKFETLDGKRIEIIIESNDTLNTRQRLQTRPGIRSITDVKYGDKGEMYYRQTIFDKFGRRIGNNDFTDHCTPKVPSHTNPHYHPNSPLDPKQHGKGIPGLHPETP